MQKNSPFINCALAALFFCAAGILILPGCNGNPVPPSLEIELFARGFTNPTACAAPRDGSGRLFVTEQTGTVRIVDGNGDVLKEPFIDVSGRMVKPSFAYDESGLLGIVFHPD